MFKLRFLVVSVLFVQCCFSQNKLLNKEISKSNAWYSAHWIWMAAAVIFVFLLISVLRTVSKRSG